MRFLYFIFFVLDTFFESVVIRHPSLCINEAAILECHVTLNASISSDLSVLNISWYHNGTYLSTNNATRDDDQYLYISTLDLISVKGTSSGNYTCQANIIEDKKTKPNFMTVSVKGQHIYVLMWLNCVPLLAIPRASSEQILYPGVALNISCESLNNSYNISGPAGFSINHPITINSLNFSVEGDYKCTSSNKCVSTLTLEMMSKLCDMHAH